MFREFRIRAAAPLTAWLILPRRCAAAGAGAPPAPASTWSSTPSMPRSLPTPQSLAAKAAVRFVPLDDNVTSATFELNNALNVSRVVDDQGKQIQASRNQQDFTVRLSFDQPLPKGQPATMTFYYDGKLTGQEDSPVYGIKFAAIHPDFAYLMYPARWFPVSGYTTDRFAADMQVTVPAGYTVLGSGLDTHQTVRRQDRRTTFKFDQPSFPGSIAVVKEQPAKVPVRRRHHLALFPRRRKPTWRSPTARRSAR